MTQVDSADHAVGPAPAAPLHLLVQTAAGTSRFPLDRPRLVFGRGEDCDLIVADPTVSRRHLVLEISGELVQFQDLGSTNEPILDGKVMARGVLAPGSWIAVGTVRVGLERGSRGDRTRQIDAAPRTALAVRPDTIGDRSTDVQHRNSALQALRWPPASGPDFVTSLAPHLLDSALALTFRNAGVIGTCGPNRSFSVLAARPADPAAFPLPGEMFDAEADSGALVIEPWPEAGAERERILVRLASGELLVLGHPAPTAPPAADVLHLAIEFGRIAARELTEARARTAERRELDALRFVRTQAGRSVIASARLQGARRVANEAAEAGLDLRLHGEEGCEYEDLARFFHARSPARSGPFVSCYARLLPGERIAQELAVGAGVHESGGTSIARATGGTLFVDAPDVLSCELQQRLARLATANRQLPDRRQRFQLVVSIASEAGDPPDLAPELRAVLESCATVAIPPLRSVPQDAIALAEVILEDLGPTPGGSPRRLTAAAERVLLGYRWPGNTAQHRRAVEAAAARAGSESIDARHFPIELHETSHGERPFATLLEVGDAHVLRVLMLSGGNRMKAARRLGIAASTLYKRLERLGL